MRRIQNIDIFYSDLECFFEPGNKVLGMIIDAYGASLQELEEHPIDYAIFPSYLGVIVSHVPPGESSAQDGSLENRI